ncbi:MAG: YceI family protein [Verrucomicrobia bacterium]|nr:YceI family protein [Verrucomicrobiota bacterium]
MNRNAFTSTPVAAVNETATAVVLQPTTTVQSFMKTDSMLNLRILLALATMALAAQLNAQLTRYEQTLPGKGSKCQINGTSSIHDWKMETPIIAGAFEADPNALQGAADGKVAATASVRIPVRTLKSYNAKMDEVYKQHMEEAKFKNITYKLKELTAKKGELSSLGDLTVHGVTKPVSIPVKIASAADNMLKISGTTKLKMSDFGVTPPNPKIAGLGEIVTGDEITVEFEWVVVNKK